MRTLRSLSLAAFVTPILLHGQDAATTARAFLDARARRDWASMVTFVDSAGLAALRAQAERGIEMVRMYDPESMRARLAAVGAEAPLKLLEASREMVGGGSLLRMAFAGVTDTSVLRSLSPRELAARWFEAKDPAYTASLLMNGMLSGILSLAPDGGAQDRLEFEEEMRAPLNWAVLGVIQERSSPALAHVTYRMAPRGPSGVLTFRQVGKRWYLWLDGEEQLDAVGRLEMAARKVSRAQR